MEAADTNCPAAIGATVSDEGVIDLSDAPRHTGFGEDTGDGTSGSFTGSRGYAASKGMPVSGAANIIGAYDETAALVDKIFDGEVTIDDLLSHAQQLVALLNSITEFGDFVVAAIGEDPSYVAGTLTKAGLDFLIAFFQPLEDFFGIFTGNPDRIGVSAQMWGTASSSLITLAEHLGATTIEGVLPSWTGGASASAALRLGEFQQAVQSTAIVCDLVKTMMEHTSGFAGSLMNQCNQITADIVESVAAGAWMFFYPNPVTVADAVTSLVIKINKAVYFLADLAIRAARVYLALAQAMVALQSTFESALPLLTRMSEAPR